MAQHLLQFQSSRSLRTATARPSCLCNDFRYFNPRGPCGPRLAIVMVFAWWGIRFQSSRSLRTATSPETGSVITQEISILAVLADRDWKQAMPSMFFFSFQSLRSLRTATRRGRGACTRCAADFNPRGPCGPRLSALPGVAMGVIISILAVLADRDLEEYELFSGQDEFQSSRSLRTATLKASLLLVKSLGFQSSRSLRTATHGQHLSCPHESRFQSSRSLRTATSAPDVTDFFSPISILAVLADRDFFIAISLLSTAPFQSSRSLRTATQLLKSLLTRAEIFQSSRSLRTATPLRRNKLVSSEFQSSRSLRTATPDYQPKR